MTIHAIDAVFQYNEVVSGDEPGVDSEATLRRYCDKLTDELREIYPSASITIRPAGEGEVGSFRVDADSDEEQTEIDIRIQEFYQRAGFFVMNDGSVL